MLDWETEWLFNDIFAHNSGAIPAVAEPNIEQNQENREQSHHIAIKWEQFINMFCLDITSPLDNEVHEDQGPKKISTVDSRVEAFLENSFTLNGLY